MHGAAECHPAAESGVPRLQFGELRTELGSGLLHYGLAPHQTVGIYSVNCTGWVLTAEACNAYSMVTVPLYDTLGPDAVRYISGHAELAAIACSASLLSVLLPCLAECPTIQLVVSRVAACKLPSVSGTCVASHMHQESSTRRPQMLTSASLVAGRVQWQP
jgi:long-subunit acyl-CoA synthetase (AMP-forming)